MTPALYFVTVRPVILNHMLLAMFLSYVKQNRLLEVLGFLEEDHHHQLEEDHHN